MKTLLRKCARRPNSLRLTELTLPTTCVLLAASRASSVTLRSCKATVRWTGPTCEDWLPSCTGSKTTPLNPYGLKCGRYRARCRARCKMRSRTSSVSAVCDLKTCSSSGE